MMDRPRIYVDFNEMVEPDLVLLSQHDTKADSAGNIVALEEGLRVYVYMDDEDQNGLPDPLIADGLAERATGLQWGTAAKWCCRIGAEGIIHASDRARSNR